MLGNGDGTFQDEPTFFPVGSTGPVAITPEFIAVADFNSDGNADVATSNKDNNTVSVLLGNGDGTFKTVTTYATGTTPLGITVADLNADGKVDVAVACLRARTPAPASHRLS